MKVLYVSSEIFPFAKTGGLADVSASLPLALKNEGIDIRLVTPFYRVTARSLLETERLTEPLKIRLGECTYTAWIRQGLLKSAVTVYFIECDRWFDREKLYGTARASYDDNAERFIFFCRCILEMCKVLNFGPDVIHCNDWQSGMLPAYHSTVARNDPFFQGSATVFTIHNAAYQGVFDKSKFFLTGLPGHFFDVNGLEFWGRLSMMKAGLVYADVINTVSREYSREILTAEFGCGLEGVLAGRKEDLYGILNGADYEVWNPSTDTVIAKRYGIKRPAGKTDCKRDLLSEFMLPDTLMDKPLIGAVGRLVDQKGFDIVVEIADDLMKLDLGFVLLGTGERKYEEFFSGLGKKFGHKAGIKIDYDDCLAHKIEAGCDMFLMPSRYEPCGLNQIYSLRYGTVPIVRATGGLVDTINDYDGTNNRGNGFVFREYSAEELLKTIKRACVMYEDRRRWRDLMLTCMACDYSWQRSARQYIKLYEEAIRKRGN